MDLGAVMDELGAKAATVTGLRAYAWPADTVVAPAIIVSYPEAIDYDALAYNRGGDRMTIPVLVVVGRQSDRASRDNLAQYADGSGSTSVKAALDGTGTAYDSARVTGAESEVVTIAGIEHAAMVFSVDVAGGG